MKLEAFDTLVRDDQRDGVHRNLLLGNGFSIARWPGIFSYGALYEQSVAGMNPSLRAIFEGQRTRDFERVLGYLRDAAVVAEYRDRDPARAHALRQEAVQLRELLIRAIVDGHPHDASALTDDEKTRCGRFLLKFDQIFTTNYDLLLYWVLMHLLGTGMMQWNRFPDAFFRGDGGPGELYWGATRDFQRVHYLHGAVHIVRQGSRHRKIEYNRDDANAIMDTLRAAMADGDFPLFVCEESAKSKLQQISNDAYLTYAYRRLSQAAGAMYVHGSSIHTVDMHLWQAISASPITRLRIAIHGDPNSNENQQNAQRAQAIVDAATTPDREVQLAFYSASDPEIWTAKA